MNALPCLAPPATSAVVVPMGRVELTFTDVVKAIRRVEKVKFYPELQDLCLHLKRNPSLLHNLNVDFRRLGIWGLALPSDRAGFEELVREYVQYLQAGDASRRISIRELADAMCTKDAHSFERKARELGVDLARFSVTDEGLKGDQKVKPFHPFFKKHQCIRRKYVQDLGVKARQDFCTALVKRDHEFFKGALIRLKRIRGKNNPQLIEYYRAHNERRPMREMPAPPPRKEIKFAAREVRVPVPVSVTEPKPAADLGRIARFATETNAVLESLQQGGQLQRSYRIDFQFEPALQFGAWGFSLRGWQPTATGFDEVIAIDKRGISPRVRDIIEDIQKKIQAEEGPERLRQAEALESFKWRQMCTFFQVLPQGQGGWRIELRLSDNLGTVYSNQAAEVKSSGQLCEVLRQWKKKGLLPPWLSMTYTDYAFSAFNLGRSNTREQLLVKELGDPAELLNFLNRA